MAPNALSHGLKVVVYLVALLAYIGLGGLLLWVVESSEEEAAIEREIVDVARANLTTAQTAYLEDIGVCYFKTVEDEREWGFLQACFFSLTLITTIGYGNVAPVTSGGRVLTVLYTLVGVGFAANAFGRIIEALHGLVQCFSGGGGAAIPPRADGTPKSTSTAGAHGQSVRAQCHNVFARCDKDGSGTIDCAELHGFLNELEGKTLDPLIAEYVLSQADVGTDGWDGTLTKEELLDAVTIFYKLQAILPQNIDSKEVAYNVLFVLFWWLALSGLIAYVEDWTYGEGLWFGYITLTTIGLGDYYPVKGSGEWLTFVFIIPGLVLVGALLTDVWKVASHYKYWWVQHAYAEGRVGLRFMELQGITPLSGGDGRFATPLSRPGSRSATPTSLPLRLPSVGSAPGVAGSRPPTAGSRVDLPPALKEIREDNGGSPTAGRRQPRPHAPPPQPQPAKFNFRDMTPVMPLMMPLQAEPHAAAMQRGRDPSRWTLDGRPGHDDPLTTPTVTYAAAPGSPKAVLRDSLRSTAAATGASSPRERCSVGGGGGGGGGGGSVLAPPRAPLPPLTASRAPPANRSATALRPILGPGQARVQGQAAGGTKRTHI